MTVQPIHRELSAYAAGVVAGAAAMLLALLPRVGTDSAPTSSRVSSAHVEALSAPAAGQSLYAAAKVGLPPPD